MNRLAMIHDHPCVCCKSMRIDQPFPTEAHHIVTNGYRRLSGGDEMTIPLCSWHHRGLCLDNHTSSRMAAIYGPSMALNKKLFVIVFGAELLLLADFNNQALLCLP